MKRTAIALAFGAALVGFAGPVPPASAGNCIVVDCAVEGVLDLAHWQPCPACGEFNGTFAGSIVRPGGIPVVGVGPAKITMSYAQVLSPVPVPPILRELLRPDSQWEGPRPNLYFGTGDVSVRVNHPCVGACTGLRYDEAQFSMTVLGHPDFGWTISRAGLIVQSAGLLQAATPGVGGEFFVGSLSATTVG